AVSSALAVCARAEYAAARIIALATNAAIPAFLSIRVTPYTAYTAVSKKRLRFGPSLKSLTRISRFCDSARGSVALLRDFRIQSTLIGVFFAVDCRDVRRILFLNFDDIDLGRAFVHRPEILIDAHFDQDALVRSFERAHIYLWLGKRHFCDWISDGGPCAWVGECCS